MRVNAEIRDLSYKKMMVPLILPIIIVPLLLLRLLLCGGRIRSSRSDSELDYNSGPYCRSSRIWCFDRLDG